MTKLSAQSNTNTKVQAHFRPAKFRSMLLDTSAAALPSSSPTSNQQSQSKPRQQQLPKPRQTKSSRARLADAAAPTHRPPSYKTIYKSDFSKGTSSSSNNGNGDASAATHTSQLLHTRRANVANSDWAALEQLAITKEEEEREARLRKGAAAQRAQRQVLETQVAAHEAARRAEAAEKVRELQEALHKAAEYEADEALKAEQAAVKHARLKADRDTQVLRAKDEAWRRTSMLCRPVSSACLFALCCSPNPRPINQHAAARC